MNYKKNINDKHFLLIGSKGYLYHTEWALNSGIKVSLLIEKSKYKKEYEKLFSSIIVIDDIFNFNQIKEAIKNLSIDVVFTRFEDYTAVVGVINEYLQLKGINYQTSRNFSNKHRMKTNWIKKNVPCADGVCANNKTNIKNFIKKYQFPLILKQTSGVHSSFVHKIKSKSDLKEKLNLFSSEGESYKTSKPITGFKNIVNKECELLLEKMLKGIEVTIDTFVNKGVFTHTPISKYILPEELNIDDSYLPISITPTNLPYKVKQNILSTTEVALKALGANNCVCHTELFYNVKDNKCWVIETTSRGGGYRSTIMNHITNTNYDKSIYLASAGEKVEKFTSNGKTLAVIEYFSEKEGNIKKMDFSFIEDIPEANILKIMFKIGDKVKLARSGGKFIVSISVQGTDVLKTEKLSIDIFNKLRKMITIE